MDSVLITEIRPQKGQLCGLYSQGELICSLDSLLVAEKGLKPGEFAVATLRELLRQSQLRRAKTKALRLLGGRDYSARALTDRLRKDFDERTVNDVVASLAEIGAVDDARYAGLLVDHYVRGRRFGRRRVARELAAKGIDPETAREALDACDADERDAIREWLEGSLGRDLADQKGVRRAVATLQRYGYCLSDILHVLRELE